MFSRAGTRQDLCDKTQRECVNAARLEPGSETMGGKHFVSHSSSNGADNTCHRFSIQTANLK